MERNKSNRKEGKMKIEIFLLLSNWSELMEECLLFDKSWILSFFTFWALFHFHFKFHCKRKKKVHLKNKRFSKLSLHYQQKRWKIEIALLAEKRMSIGWIEIALSDANCPGAKLSGAKLSWCQIVLVPNCPVPNCPVPYCPTIKNISKLRFWD